MREPKRIDNDFEVGINLHGALVDLTAGRFGQLQVQKHEVEFLLPRLVMSALAVATTTPLNPFS
jgi:hypothetical protein